MSDDYSTVDGEMSPTTLAGVEVMNTFHPLQGEASSTVEQEEDLVLQCRILQSKGLDDRRARQRAEDELKFVKHKLSEREKKLEYQLGQLSKQQTEIYSLQKQLDEKASVAATLKQQVEALSAQLYNSQSEVVRQRDRVHELQVNHYKSHSPAAPRHERRGSVTDLINEKTKTLGLQRQIKGMRRQHESMCQAMEMDLMYEADLHSALTQRNLARGITPINDLLRAQESGDGESEEGVTTKGRGRTPAGLVSYEGIRRYGRGQVHITFNEPVDLRTPHEGFIDAKVKASGFSDEYKNFRQAISKAALDWKQNSDNALSALFFIFNEREKGTRGVLQNPKEDFHKEIKLALTKSKTSLLEVVRSFNDGLKKVLGAERRVKLDWLKEEHPSADFSVQVEIPPPEDPRIATLTEEVGFLKLRQQQIHEEHNQKTSALEMQREKAEVNTQYLQQKVFSLHSAVHNALLSVYKHRFRWASRCPNHFAPLEKKASKKRQLEVGYNVQLGEAIDLEVKSLGHFADYFVSDQLFGVDLGSSGGDAKENDGGVSLVLKRKEAVPMKKAKVTEARRLSTQLDTMLKREKEESSAAVENDNSSESDNEPLASTAVPSKSKKRGSPSSRVERNSVTPPPIAPVKSPKPQPQLHHANSGSNLRQLQSNITTSVSARCSSANPSKPRSRSQSPRQAGPHPAFEPVPMASSMNTKPNGPTRTIVRPPPLNHGLHNHAPRSNGSSPISPAVVASLIPTTINIELDPNSLPVAPRQSRLGLGMQRNQRAYV